MRIQFWLPNLLSISLREKSIGFINWSEIFQNLNALLLMLIFVFCLTIGSFCSIINVLRQARISMIIWFRLEDYWISGLWNICFHTLEFLISVGIFDFVFFFWLEFFLFQLEFFISVGLFDFGWTFWFRLESLFTVGRIFEFGWLEYFILVRRLHWWTCTSLHFQED